MFTDLATHPGTITFIAPDGSETVQQADTMPDWLKFVNGRDGRPVPVVLIARVRAGSAFTLRSYGADGRLLAITPVPAGPLSAVPSRTSGWF